MAGVYLAVKEQSKRMRLLKIWEILKQETDEDHPMGTTQLIAKLKEFGIDCDRRTLYADIKALNEGGYEILKNRGISNEYYVIDRSFDEPELHILMDAVQEARFITEKKTGMFIDKIANLAGSRRGEVLKRNVVNFNNTKTDNESIYYNIDIIHSAIRGNKKVRFLYFDHNVAHERVHRKQGKFYYMNPVATIMDNGNYYLLCYDKFHSNIMHFRVDRMEQVEIISYDKEILEEFKEFDVRNHKKQLFGMFSGQEQEVTLRVDKELIDTVYDLFGMETKLMVVDENKVEFRATVQKSNLFFGWCCSFGEKIKLIAPGDLIEEFKQYMSNIAQNYNT